MNFDVEDTRRKLTAMANKFGWDTPSGHRCSNLIKALVTYREATGQQAANLEQSIKVQMDELAALTK